MIKLIIFSTLVLSLFILRLSYIRFLCDDWNTQLAILIAKVGNKHNLTPNVKYLWMEKYYLNPWKCSLQVHKYRIKHFVDDPILVQDIHQQIQDKYIK